MEPGGGAGVGYGREDASCDGRGEGGGGVGEDPASTTQAYRRGTVVRESARETAPAAVGDRRNVNFRRSEQRQRAGQIEATTTRGVNIENKISYVHDLSFRCI